MKVDQIKKVAVVGAGLMGHGIAQAYAQEGFEVNLTDASASALASAKDRIRSNLTTFVDEGLFTKRDLEQTLDRVSVFNDLMSTVHNADFVTEAIVEQLEKKQKLFQEMEQYCSADAILASNTSSFPMTEIAALMARPERAVITHWVNPPHIIPVVEVVSGKKTAEETYAVAIALLKKIKKIPITCRKEVPGFLLNRLQTAMNREVYALVESGTASAEDIDLLVVASLGFRMATLGPLRIRDLAGLDVTYAVEGWLAGEINSDTGASKLLKEKAEKGEFGAKTGKGFYEYSPGEVEAIIKERDRQFVRRLKELYR